MKDLIDVKFLTREHWVALHPVHYLWLAAVGIALLVAAAVLAGGSAGEPDEPGAASEPLPARQIAVRLPPPDLLRPLAPEDAVAENAARPFSDRPDDPAAPFAFRGNGDARLRALECLTQAVYYEAATEGADGGRAVAQVVLNRVRHPAYPSSVCGVVYQGSERATGCQFTFTCDGSLRRMPSATLWKQARAIADAALGGAVDKAVGHATHYHADYVLPYWADSLDKARQVGRHIFYRLKGGLGARAIFRQRHSGIEAIPILPSSVEVAEEAIVAAEAKPEDPLGPQSDLVAPAGTLAAETGIDTPLAADLAAGTLIRGGDRSPSSAAEKAADPCEAGRKSRKLQPMKANDMRAGSADAGC